MIVKPDCPVKLTDFQARRILTQLQLGNYFQTLKGGAETLPPFSGFLKEFDTVAKQFFYNTDYNLNEFVNDAHNSVVIAGVLKNLFQNTSQKNIDNLELLRTAINEAEDATNNEILEEAKRIAEEQKRIEEENKGFIDTEALLSSQQISEFNKPEFENEREFYSAMFNNTSYVETKFNTFFIRDILIPSVLIDVASKTIPNTEGSKGEINTNNNIKSKRKGLLEKLLNDFPVNMVNRYTDPFIGEIVKNTPITLDMAVNEPKVFSYLMEELQSKITKPTYKGAVIDLIDPNTNLLFSVARDADQTKDPESVKIIDDYLKFIALRRFDDVMRFAFGEYVYTSKDSSMGNFNDDLKYKFIVEKKTEAFNANFADEVKGLETLSNLYGLIINNTPILDVNTGLETKAYLEKSIVQRAFIKYFNNVDPNNSVESIKAALIEGMQDSRNLWDDRNILYTLYKSFFEEFEDSTEYTNRYSLTNTIEYEAKRNSTYPKSYLQTIVHNGLEKEHELILLLTDPLKNISKIEYAQTNVSADGIIKIEQLAVDASSSTSLSVERAIFNQLSNSEKVLENFEKYKPVGLSSIDATVEFVFNDVKYAIKGFDEYLGDGITNLPEVVINALSKDLLGIDFERSLVDRDFKNELASRELDNVTGEFPNYYIQFLRQALKITVAKHTLLTDNDIRNMIANKRPGVALLTGNMIINDSFGEEAKAISLERLDNYKFSLNTMSTTQPVVEAYTSSKDRVTGNTSKSTLSNKEGNAISGYAKYNLFSGLTRSLIATRVMHNSIKNYNDNENVFSHNALIKNPNLLKALTYREAIEVNDRVIPNSKQTALTTFQININGGYFSMLQQQKEIGNIQVIIDPTTYSDKRKNALAVFNNDLTINGKPYTLFLDANGKVPDVEQSIELQYQTSGNYYKKYGQNLINDWITVIKKADVNNIFDLDGFNKIKTISGKMNFINEFNSGDFWYSNAVHPVLRGRDAAIHFAGLSGIVLNNYVHYQNNGKTFTNKKETTPLVMKKSLIDEITLYDHNDSSKLKAWLDKKLVDDVNAINKTDFTLTGDAYTFINKQYPESNNFIGYVTETVAGKNKNIPHYKLSNSKVISSVNEILPAYRKFFYDWNFLTDNLLNIALGNIHAHKGSNPNAAWTAMTKRNVQAGATIQPYALGLEKGVEEFTRTAFVDDIVTHITTVHGNQEVVVDIDGGAFVTMTQRLKTYYSLNKKYQGGGGPEQKPFISHMDYLKGQNGETKFADFVLDKETIRNSIGSNTDWMEIHRNHLYNVPIDHLDVTKSWKKGVDLVNLDLYVYDRQFNHETGEVGKIYRIHSIKNIENNMYKVLKNDPINNSNYTEIVQLNTWFDLWNVLGNIDNVIPSKKVTSIYHTTPSGIKVYYEESDSSWEKLLDYEAYIGDPEHKTIRADYLPGTGEFEVDMMYKLYSELTGETDIVMPKLDALVLTALGDTISEVEYRKLGLHNTTPYNEFVDIALENSQDLSDFYNNVFEIMKDPKVSKLAKTWQPMKGKLIDRITTSGAQKYGQFNSNRSTVYNKVSMNNFISEISENIESPIFDENYVTKLIENKEIIKTCD